MENETLVLEAELAEIQQALAANESDTPGGTPRAELEAREKEIEKLLAAVDEALEPPAPVEEVDGEVVDPMEFAPAGAELVVTPEADTFAVLDRHDEAAIMAELASRGTKRLFYDFQQDGTRLVDLSIHGVLECIGLMNRTGKVSIAIDPSSAVIERVQMDGGEHVKARVYARDAVTGFGVFGTSTCAQYMKRRNGAEKFDPFAETKALNQAQRNALGMLIPQKIRQAMIAQATGNKQLMAEVQHGVGAASAAELPPPLDDERAKELTAACKTAFDELRDLNAMAMMPGQYHVALSRAASSHEQLEALRDRLVAQVDHEREKVAS